MELQAVGFLPIVKLSSSSIYIHKKWNSLKTHASMGSTTPFQHQE